MDDSSFILHALKRLLKSSQPKGLPEDSLHSNKSKSDKMLFRFVGQSTFRVVVTIVPPVQTFKMET